MSRKSIIIFISLLLLVVLSACAHTHEYGEWQMTAAPSCEAIGVEERVCKCGEKETREIAAKGHDLTEATCDTPRVCRICGVTAGEAMGHTWVDASCDAPKTCSACGLTEGEPLSHAWYDATCELPKICARCMHTEGEPLGHDWSSASCEEAKTCAVCDKTDGAPVGHVWQTETCTKPKTCSVCGETTGKALGHSYSKATCTEPKTCSVCGKTSGTALSHDWIDATCATPKTCSRCNATEGEPLDQSHEYVLISEVLPTLLGGGSRVEECSVCHDKKTTALDVIDPLTLNIPVIYIDDIVEGAKPVASLTKPDGSIMVRYHYVSNDETAIPSFDAYCDIKIQGSSSAAYPKKNFTVKFYEDEELSSKMKVDLGWGKEYKYCMKANYIDFSQSRNVVSGKLFAQIVASRNHINEGLLSAPNYGLVDGYPVLVYVNNTFHGIYTMNIPKEDWMFGMEGEEGSMEALLMADKWTDSVNLLDEIGSIYEDYGWEVEYCSTEEDGWVRESFNQLIRLLNCGDNERIRNELANHLDVEAAIDNMLFTFFLNGADNVGKNVLWATYDGVIWIPSMYDMDSTYGINWQGKP
ncbi:MAG: CotH kinase family protein, partial [Clostridia bacterium]|nr:CotH kinase family protein [Clostridia bacterium]